MGVSKTKDSVTGPLHLALDITNKCNYRCLHYYNASGENCVVDNELTDEEVLELINQISKIKPHTFLLLWRRTAFAQRFNCKLR